MPSSFVRVFEAHYLYCTSLNNLRLPLHSPRQWYFNPIPRHGFDLHVVCQVIQLFPSKKDPQF